MRVLIVEDDPLIALDLQSIVEEEGHDVVGVCSSLSEARARLGEPLDFALLDVDITEGKSFEIAYRLAERQIPFVFVSASRRGEVPESLRGAAFIPKPYEERAIRRSMPRRG